MDFVYHQVPENMQGDILYPLNVLKTKYSEIYEAEMKKYQGREKLLEVKIPPLNCLWNDVLHFTAVEPQNLREKFVEAGIKVPKISWFKIPIDSLQKQNIIVYPYRSVRKEFKLFDSKKMDFYRTIPKEMIKYYREQKVKGLKPLMFHFVPHILYKGSVDTKGLEIVRT